MIHLQGTLNLASFATLTPQLSSYFQEYTPKDLVLNLTEVTMIDSSIIRLFLNIKKRVENNKNRLYIMRPSEELVTLLSESKLDQVMTIINDSSELQRLIERYTYDRYVSFTEEEKIMRRLQCSCGACGSQNVVGYLLNSGAYHWKWRDDDYYPMSDDANGKFFDYYSMLPIVCLDCYMTSTDISHFNVIDEAKNIHYKSVLDDKTKVLLSKSIKKRKKMMELDTMITESFFQFPRNRISSFYIYGLAEACSRTISINKGGVDPFTIGYMNFLTIQYASEDQRPELISNCRTWLTQMVADTTQQYSYIQMAQCFYILMVASLTIEKFKEASKYYQDFSILMKTVPDADKSETDINSPEFWFLKADSVWQKEIEKKSSALKV
jgi:anti-anti-sigma factor